MKSVPYFIHSAKNLRKKSSFSTEKKARPNVMRVFLKSFQVIAIRFEKSLGLYLLVATSLKQPPEVFYKKRCSKHFAILQENTLKRLQHRCFLVNIVKFLRTPIFKKTTDGCSW